MTTYFETSLSKVEPNRREDVNLSGQKWAAYFSSNCTVSDGSHDIYTYYVTSVVPMPLFLMFIYIYISFILLAMVIYIIVYSVL